MGTLDEIYQFSEKRFTTFNHSLVVFVHGVDVSRWIKGGVTITYAGTDSYNTASFTLSNPRKIFQISADNLCGPTGKCSDPPKMRLGGHEYSEDAKSQVFFYKQNVNSSSENIYYDTTKSGFSIGSSALGTRRKNTVPGANPFSFNKYFPPKQYEETRYRLYENDCIFNKNDYVRIFKKNPFSRNFDQWVEIYCGFVQDHPVTTNYITGESTINITCSCIKQQMQKMRVNINIHRADLDSSPLIETGFYRDFLNPSELTHPFAMSSLENTIKMLVLGSFNPQREPDKMSEDEKKRKVGEFKLGNIVCYDPSNPGNTLERWHLMTAFGVNKVPFPKGGNSDDLWLTTAEMNAIGAATRAARDADDIVGGPTARYLHMLLPASGTGPGSLIQYSIVKSGNGAEQREWASRWEIIREFAQKLDFQVLTSPSGDILVEFPQYGFTPCAYLTNFNADAKATPEKVTDAATSAKSSLSSPLKGTSTGKGSKKAFQQCHVGRPDGGYESGVANLFIFRMHVKEETLNDEAEDFPTILQISGGFVHQDSPQPNAKENVLNPRGYIYSPVLVARYGVITSQIDFPFAGQRKDEFGDADSAFTKRLAKLGLIEYTRRMADASTWQGSLVYRPFLFPNRPIHLRRCQRIGLMSSVSYTYNIGQNVSMSVNSRMLMARRHDGSYRLLTGSVNTPIDYGAIWSETEVGTKDGGAVVNVSSSNEKDYGATTAEAKEEIHGGPTPASYKPPSDASLEGLMPEFKTIVKRLIKISQEVQSGNPLVVNSVVRNWGGRSKHEFGLAVDVQPMDSSKVGGGGMVKKREDARGYYQAIIKAYNDQYKDAWQRPIWGGSSSTFEKDNPKDPSTWHYDNIHFESPAAWGAVSSQYEQLRKAGKNKEEATQAVWAAVRSKVPDVKSLLAPDTPVEEPKENPSKSSGSSSLGSFANAVQGSNQDKALGSLFNSMDKAGAKDVNQAGAPGATTTTPGNDPTQPPPPAPCGRTNLLPTKGLKKDVA